MNQEPPSFLPVGCENLYELILGVVQTCLRGDGAAGESFVCVVLTWCCQLFAQVQCLIPGPAAHAARGWVSYRPPGCRASRKGGSRRVKVTLQNALELGSQISVLLLDLFIRLCFNFCALHPPPKPPSYLPPQEGLGRVHLLAEPG